jgi:hypothetical protein
MRPFEDLRSGLTPAVEQLRESWDETYPKPLRGRELAVEAATAAAFLAVAVSLAVFVQSGPAFDAQLALALVGTYAVLAMVRFPIGYGYTIPTQIVLVPMLFLLPLGSVPLLVAAGMVLGSLHEYVRRERHPNHVLATVGNAWHSVGPVAVFAAAGGVAPELSEWPLLLAALAAQILVDNGVATLREWAGFGISQSCSRRCSAGSRSWTCCCRRSASWPLWPPSASHTRCCSCSHLLRCCSSSPSSAAHACARRSS